ncbi:MAG: cyclopropane-fatty-acyl-phospholipid synthase family protein [Gammaproteobacteria bacterium]|nr:cyclopropane-fatty-acyl-phospholipid synthase family protein [Gammaproteobacteria bacterium]NNC57787.1 class I SAM-dependent methyltransferase [Woeseiaceae bacterium]NNL51145.1 class I SAM-dependent methyltransferase [Woeseiaceae bacterium]
MTGVATRAIGWTESGLVPDSVIRSGMRRLMERKLAEIRAGDVEATARALHDFVAMMRRSPIALVPDVANEQHYEVPAEFFAQVLGENRKYSCCHWPSDVSTLGEAEESSLQLTVERAGIQDGMKVLDLGCGWGSLSLWVAEHFPNASVTSVSNSHSQREFILAQAAERGIENMTVSVCDMNDFDAADSFDRIVSVEMFEHMRNYDELFRRINSWLVPEGRFFMHIFCHRSTPYEYIDKGPSDWMSRHFFSGGIMPSADLPLMFPEHLNLERRWAWNGMHYAKTCRAWLNRMDSRRSGVLPLLSETYGEKDAGRWWMRWRMFFMACEELFRFNDGQEWFVSHYLFKKGGE